MLREKIDFILGIKSIRESGIGKLLNKKCESMPIVL